jgi:hypothetical protein
VTPNAAMAEYQRTGGVLVLRHSRGPEFLQLEKELGRPDASWINQKGQGTLVYYAPLKDNPRQENGDSSDARDN